MLVIRDKVQEPAMAISKTPRFSAVVPTRNRPDHAVPCAGSILSNAGDDFELLIVDQSDDATTEQSLAVYATDPRFRYIRSPSRGASAARNIGVEQSTAPIIAFTDDDCRVSVDCLQQITTLFEQEPEAARRSGRSRSPTNSRGGDSRTNSSCGSASTTMSFLRRTQTGMGSSTSR
jgi:GT2 family glycosyltransferase